MSLPADRLQRLIAFKMISFIVWVGLNSSLTLANTEETLRWSEKYRQGLRKHLKEGAPYPSEIHAEGIKLGRRQREERARSSEETLKKLTRGRPAKLESKRSDPITSKQTKGPLLDSKESKSTDQSNSGYSESSKKIKIKSLPESGVAPQGPVIDGSQFQKEIQF